MDERLKEALVEIFNSTVSAKDFLVSNLPDVINQLLVWKFWMSLVYNAAAVLICVIFFICVFLVFKKWDKILEKDLEFGVIICTIMIVPVALVSFVCLINFDWLNIYLAPKIYLIEYAARMVK